MRKNFPDIHCVSEKNVLSNVLQEFHQLLTDFDKKLIRR